MSRRHLLLTLLVGHAACQQNHVVELHDSADVDASAVMGVFTNDLKVGEAAAAALVKKLSDNGKAVVVMGPKESCDAIAQKFEAVSLKATVRPLAKNDIPGEYDDSDVVEMSAADLKASLEAGKTVLVTFSAPWCGHCKQLVPEWKRVATSLKASGVVVAMINGDENRALTQELGVRGFPTIKCFSGVGSKGADYQGARSATDIVQWTQQQAMIGKAKALAGQAVGKVADGVKSGLSKLGLSKVAARQEGAVAAAAA